MGVRVPVVTVGDAALRVWVGWGLALAVGVGVAEGGVRVLG